MCSGESQTLRLFTGMLGDTDSWINCSRALQCSFRWGSLSGQKGHFQENTSGGLKGSFGACMFKNVRGGSCFTYITCNSAAHINK